MRCCCRKQSVPLANEEVQICFDNPNNPYEYVGEQHNLALDAIAATPGFESLSLEEAHEIATQSVESNLNLSTGISFQDVTGAYDMLDAEEPILASAQSLYEDGVISELAYNKLLALNQILDDSEDPVSYGHAVIDLENEVLQDNAYSSNELELILGACSIARHSACYWMTAALDANSAWFPHLGIDANDLTGDIEARWKWWKKVKKIFKKIIKWVKYDITGYKYAYKVIGWFWNGEQWVRIVASVVVGIVYSWKKIFG